MLGGCSQPWAGCGDNQKLSKLTITSPPMGTSVCGTTAVNVDVTVEGGSADTKVTLVIDGAEDPALQAGVSNGHALFKDIFKAKAIAAGNHTLGGQVIGRRDLVRGDHHGRHDRRRSRSSRRR